MQLKSIFTYMHAQVILHGTTYISIKNTGCSAKLIIQKKTVGGQNYYGLVVNHQIHQKLLEFVLYSIQYILNCMYLILIYKHNYVHKHTQVHTYKCRHRHRRTNKHTYMHKDRHKHRCMCTHIDTNTQRHKHTHTHATGLLWSP